MVFAKYTSAVAVTVHLCCSLYLVADQFVPVAAQHDLNRLPEKIIGPSQKVFSVLCEPGSQSCDDVSGGPARMDFVKDMLERKWVNDTEMMDIERTDIALNESHVEASKDEKEVDDESEWTDEKWQGFSKQFFACHDYDELWKEDGDWHSASSSSSLMQEINILHNPTSDDACLVLSQGDAGHFLHACASNRPHYHEVFVHYPARFLDKVERVLFIGGGDSMVLHEVLKYKDLKKVVGLELDQHVVRTVYQSFGTQPHFDNEKVEWYFGDAAAAMRAIPRDYYGTFDLVVVDILTYIAQMLKVTEEYSIMEAAMLLLKPDGIIIKNEDEGYVPGTSPNFAGNMVDVVYNDVPLYCLQTFVMGSNGINFLTKTPVDHDIPMLYLEDVDSFQKQFNTWYTVGRGAQMEGETEIEENVDAILQAPDFPPLGLTTILEAERIELPMLDSPVHIQALVSEVLKDFSLTPASDSSINYLKPPKKGLENGYSLNYLFKEGSVVGRCFPNVAYCSFDIQMWSNLNKLYAITSHLADALKSQEQSIYRIVSSGLVENSNMEGPPPAKDKEVAAANDKDLLEFSSGFYYDKMADPTIHWKNATLHSYDNTDALHQWESQEAVGVQTFMRLQMNSPNPMDLGDAFVTDLRQKLKTSISAQLRMPSTSFNIHLEDHAIAGPDHDGHVFTMYWDSGSLVALWDGSSRLDINGMEIRPTTGSYKKNSLGMSHILKHHFRNWTLVSRDVFPRGMNRVLNFEHDYEVREEYIPYWAEMEEDQEAEES